MTICVGRAFLTLAAIFLAHSTAAASCKDYDEISQLDIYPSAHELPSNLLRIYLYFPNPVRSENTIESIALKDSDGRIVEGIFLPNRFDLWSPDRRRLTLLLNPARVKTDLLAHERLGRALIPGETYSLVIELSQTQETDCKLEGDTVFEFSVIDPDYTAPNPNDWVIMAPAAGTIDPITVDLGSSHDHISLAYRLRIKDTQGRVVPGSISLGANESVWSFTPAKVWKSAVHYLAIDEALEDLAGNRPSGLFDRPYENAPLKWLEERSWHPR